MDYSQCCSLVWLGCKLERDIFQLINYLLSKNTYISSKNISEDLDFKIRKVPTILDNTDNWLKSKGFSKLKRLQGKGIKLSSKDILRIKAVLLNERISFDFTNSNDRRTYALYSLMCFAKVSHLKELANSMNISGRTISNDMIRLRKQLSDCKVKLIYNSSKGYKLVGDLFLCKCFLISNLKQIFLLRSEKEVVNFIIESNTLSGSKFISPEKIQNLYQDIDNILPIYFSTEAKITVLVYLIITCTQSDRNFDYYDKEDNDISNNKAMHDLGSIIALKGEEEINVHLKKIEQIRISTLLQSQSNELFYNYTANYPFEIEIFAHQMIQDMSQKCKIDFQRDQELFDVLSSHLINLISRIRYHTQIRNPLLEKVKRHYSQIHKAVISSIQYVQAYTENRITEDEISFITIYFASAMEKISNQQNKNGNINIIIVCNSGNAVSRLLQYKLLNSYQVNILGTLSEQEIRAKNDIKNLDLIITVIGNLNLKLKKNVPIIKVNAFPTKSDYKKLEKFINQKRHKNYPYNSLRNVKNGILQFLPRSNFQIINEGKSIDDLIQSSGNLLARNKYCDIDYVKQMIKVAHQFGGVNHLLIAPGIILPHAGISSHVFKTGMSLLKLKEPFNYKGEKIMVFIAFCTINNTQHQGAFQQLGYLLDDKEFLEEFKEIKNYDDFKSLILRSLKKGEKL